MSTVAIFEIQKAMYTVLAADAPFMALIGSRLYDDIPDNTIFPYYQIGEATEAPLDTFSTIVHDDTVTHHIFESRKNYEGTGGVVPIMTAANALLDRQSLTITGGSHIQTRREFHTVIRDPGGIYHGVMRFRVNFQET